MLKRYLFIFILFFLYQKIALSSNAALPLPRFVSLKSNAVNIHVGPGGQYPILWKYVRQWLPVEIIAEFEHWRQIRDIQGTIGWIHKTLLSGKRFAFVMQKVRNIHAKADPESTILATIDPGVIVKILEGSQLWCKVEVQGIKGYIKRDALWGVYPDELKF